jgi:hypothetical protein
MPHAKLAFMAVCDPLSNNAGLARPQLAMVEIIEGLAGIDKDRMGNLKQALNQAFDGAGKATGAYKVGNLAVWHASSGNGAKSVCLFYTLGKMAGKDLGQLVAIGQHETSTKYKLDWGRAVGDMATGKTLSI